MLKITCQFYSEMENHTKQWRQKDQSVCVTCSADATDEASAEVWPAGSSRFRSNLKKIKWANTGAWDLELGLKREALGAVDGSSLEALLKGEPLDRRSGVSELRGPEDDPATVEPPATSAATHTSSGRIRKVRLKPGWTLMFPMTAVVFEQHTQMYHIGVISTKPAYFSTSHWAAFVKQVSFFSYLFLIIALWILNFFRS